jgi:hypothetical protein
MTTLASRATVVLGSEKFDTHVVRIEVTLTTLPGVSAFHAYFPPSLSIGAAPGDDASLELDGGEGSELVLTGAVRAIRRGLLHTEVICADGGAALARFRPAKTYRNQDANAVIRALASDADVGVSTSEVELPLAAFVAHQGRSAAQHIASLAAFTGAMARCDADGKLEVNRPAGVMPDIALRYGRELITYESVESEAPAAKRVRTGSGPAGSALAPNALRPTKKALPAGADDPGPDAVWTPAAILRTPAAAATAGVAADMSAAAAATRVRATAFLLPKLRPGSVVSIQDIPDPLAAGPWLVTRVSHVLDVRGGGRTYFEGESASAFSLDGLLGAALSAVGGLL